MPTTLVPENTQRPQTLAEREVGPVAGPAPFETDVLAEWTSTMKPGQTSWDSTTLSPKETEIAGFAFGGR